MRVVFAPDKFAGTLSASEVSTAMVEGWRTVRPNDELISCPIADGGEGTITVLADAVAGATLRSAEVTNALGESTVASYLELVDGRIVVEAASACGISDVPVELRHPANLTSYGLGQLLRIIGPAKEIIVSLGGSATVDGGAGMLQALGHQLVDSAGVSIAFGLDGLRRLSSTSKRSDGVRYQLSIAVDVDAVLLGKNGAVYRFGPQKGLDSSELAEADQVMERYATVTREVISSADPTEPGSGAAGGIGFALSAYEDGRIVPGAATIAELVGLPEALTNADLVITGEGKVDKNTAIGKGPGYVADIARRHNASVAVIAGSIEPGADSQFDFALELGPRGMTEAYQQVHSCAARAALRQVAD